MSLVIVSIGGDSLRLAVGDSKTGELSNRKNSTTDSNPAKAVNTIVSYVHTIKKPLERIVVGVRGRLNEEKSKISNDTILAKWVDYDLKEELYKHLNIPVFLENDAALAGLGEAVYGAGKEFDYIVYHSVGAGVGGVKIEEKHIDHGTLGFEPGHQILDIDRTVLGEDVTPTLENLISAKAVAERYGTKPKDIPQDDVLWSQLAHYLGQGLRNSILYWSPEAIILGGQMILGKPCIELEHIRKETVSALDEFYDCPYITKGLLADEAALYGGMALKV